MSTLFQISGSEKETKRGLPVTAWYGLNDSLSLCQMCNMYLRSVCVNRAEGSRSFIVMTVLFSCLKINNTSSDYWNYFFDNVPSQYLSWHWLKYLLPHDISEPIDFTTLCQPSSHLPAYIHYLLTFLKWVATFNSQCRVFRLLLTSSGTANSSKRKWLLTTKHVSKLTHSLKTSL